MAITINDNTIDMSKYKGEIKPCPYCTPKSTGDPEKDERNLLEALSNTNACKWCMSQRFVSICTNCNGTGQFSGRTMWDGGRSPHISTCNPCGGNGMYPAKKPKDIKATLKVVETPAATVT